jgi:hypothetical protein
MFQRAMSIRKNQPVNPKFVNRLLAVNFDQMDQMGVKTMRPFLQDVVRFDGLVGSLARSFVADPEFMPEIIRHVGVPALVDWIGHVGMMGVYSALDNLISPFIRPLVDTMPNPRVRFEWRRKMEAWKFGSGNDYVFSKEN